jgi:hypothetical protein
MVRRAGVKPTSSVAEGAAAIMNLALSPSLEGRSRLVRSKTLPAPAARVGAI